MGDDEIDDLAAVWGREASASAPPSSRPEIAAWATPPGRHETESETEVGRRGPRRGRALAGLAMAIAVAVVAAIVLLGDDDREPTAERPTDSPTTSAPFTRKTNTKTTADSTAPTVAPSATDATLVRPMWTASVVCPRFEEPTDAAPQACLLATDDERAYVVVSFEDGQQVRALDVATGQVRWEHTFVEGVRTIERLPSLVTIGGVGARSASADDPGDPGRTVALDPVTGEVRWERTGWVSGPVGRDHVILDHTVWDSDRSSSTSTMTVVEAATGREVFARTAVVPDMTLHGCGEAAIVLAAEDGTLTAHDLVGGAALWSIDVPLLDGNVPVHCDPTRVAFVADDTLRLLDIGSGVEIESRVVAFDEDDVVEVLAVTGGVVVVGSVDGVNAYDAVGLNPGWLWRCVACGPLLPVGSIEDDVAVVMAGELIVHSQADIGSGPMLMRLPGLTDKALVDGTLLAWDASRFVAVRVDALDRAVQAEVEGVRAAAAGSGHVVVATEDEVRAYPLVPER